MLTGSLVAIVTPMFADGGLDFARLKSLIEWHIAEGTDGIVIVGTTGESATVDFDENQRLIAAAVEYVGQRVPVIAGAGANSTKEAIQLTEFSKRAGADYALSVVPYYNKPTQEGMFQHFRAIAQSTDLPIILYNVPGRTVADMANETVLRLAEFSSIVGLKDATGNIARAIDLLAHTPKEFALYSGDDMATLPLILVGGHGTISVTANVAPRLMHEMCAAALEGDIATAIALNNRLIGLHQQLFVEPNPIPVKWALQQMRLMEGGTRLPLTTLEPKNAAAVQSALRAAGIALA